MVTLADDAAATSANEIARRAEEDAASLGLESGSSSGVDWAALADRLSPDYGADPFETFLFVCHVLNRSRQRVEVTRRLLDAIGTPNAAVASDELTRAHLTAFSDVMAAVGERLEFGACCYCCSEM